MAAARAARRPPRAHHKRTKAAAASAAAPAPAPKPAARRGRPAKKAVKPAAKRRELKSDALEEEVECESAWGTLPIGTLVLDAQHTNLLMKSKRVYGDNPHSFVCPAEQILHASFDMAPYQLPKTDRWAHVTGAVQMAAEDDELTMGELKDR